MISNNVTRLLDSKKIAYQAFTLPPEKLGAAEAANFMNVPLNEVYKSIIIKREKPGKPIIAVTPGDKEVNLRLLASAIGEKKVFVPTQAEAEKMTGLKAGGISPLALINRGFQVIIDSSASTFSHIHISGGQLGLNIRLPVSSLVEITHALLANITTTKEGD
jgi:Cys-tRNA(Pro)/Cys-tRNA(Cys) deacylase